MTIQEAIQILQNAPIKERTQAIELLIQSLQLDVTSAEGTRKTTMEFAGCWSDMTEETFQKFTADIKQRRSQAFSRRREDEGIAP